MQVTRRWTHVLRTPTASDWIVFLLGLCSIDHHQPNQPKGIITDGNDCYKTTFERPFAPFPLQHSMSDISDTETTTSDAVGRAIPDSDVIRLLVRAGFVQHDISDTTCKAAKSLLEIVMKHVVDDFILGRTTARAELKTLPCVVAGLAKLTDTLEGVAIHPLSHPVCMPFTVVSELPEAQQEDVSVGGSDEADW